MKNLNVNNEVDYKALYESAMKALVKAKAKIDVLEAEVADLETELDEAYEQMEHILDSTEGAMKIAKESTTKLSEAKQKIAIYECLMIKAEYATKGLGLESLDAIFKEYEAVAKGKTTGYVYLSDEELNAKLLQGYELDIPTVEHIGNVSYVKFGE